MALPLHRRGAYDGHRGPGASDRLGRFTAGTSCGDAGRGAALRLETALLFSEVRAIATAEERRRLAREIHDGIAQELASLGYVVDDLSAEVATSPTCSPSSRTCAAS